MSSTKNDSENEYSAEEVEKWLDDHPEFVHSYFSRKASRSLFSRTRPRTQSRDASTPPTSGTSTPVRKISASDLDTSMRGVLKPILNVVDGQTSFLSPDREYYTKLKRASYRKSREELSRLDETELMMELVKDIAEDLELRSLCHKILQNVSILVNGDRCSMFLVQGSVDGPRCLVSTVFDVNAESKVEDLDDLEEIRVPIGTGVVGYVAEKGETVNIANAYEDERFNQEIDKKTGYKTRSILCMPVRNSFGEVIAVSQVINKHGIGKINHTFTAEDEKIFSRFLTFCGIAIHNAELYETSQKEIKRNQVLLDLAKTIFEEQCSLENIVHKIMMITQSLLQCERCSVLLVDQNSKNLFSRAFDLEAKDVMFNEDNSTAVRTRKSRAEVRFPVNIGITGHVATTGQTLNIPDAYADPRFDPIVDETSGFKTKTILCMPIHNSSGEILGVVQLLNKVDNTPFNANDENLFEAFAIFCGMAIHNTSIYEDVQKAMAKQRVAFEILSYHATASPEEVTKLKKMEDSPAISRSLLDFGFDDDTLDEMNTCYATLNMFYELGLHLRFGIEKDVLCRWIMSVKKNYRHVTYHNWRHAFNVGQTMFAIIKSSTVCNYLSEIERLALLVACLCHDLDHRGTNNSFQVKIDSPLARLYSTSTMEHHHFDHCIMILHSQGNEIFGGLTTDEYEAAFRMLELCILATDLALYFKNRNKFFELTQNSTTDWHDMDNKQLLSAMMMTACDVSAITKPWAVQRRVAKLVSEEFFLQGDLEMEELKEQPAAMMDRGKKDKLPEMQIGFIDGICLPVYKAFALLCPSLQPMLDGVLDNRRHWQELADTQKRKMQENHRP
ncbi:dual 3',5'-cyclic-AMP and -GMP phosphodiesterase 11-like isoform X2 [Dendronephthya gigantea]|uniref:dual 3',5'-cyclic-AMP and -GMP phosphodiesterase 11-like isoform X2 n=1 Tax=Dendronephthya gigantea TaxID=151771 RepID=UPI001069C9EA|nr:dual 3',5'-cyclic-AMP and -GMP phosphodiesterase 11-like isoform X2 [Dendronephthya gigantea]